MAHIETILGIEAHAVYHVGQDQEIALPMQLMLPFIFLSYESFQSCLVELRVL